METQRRAFFEHLLTLPTYPSYRTKSHFGTLVPKYFAEFEDLQDRAVDAILDLCEDDDEKVRVYNLTTFSSVSRLGKALWDYGNVGSGFGLIFFGERRG
jgi:hypothetical protein